MTEETGQALEQSREQDEEHWRHHYSHVEGVTVGTVIEYDDWQWVVVTEVAEDHDPPKFGFVLLDELGDTVIEHLEAARGCAEHYAAVEQYRGGEHEYWTDVDYVVEDDIWSVRGPVHPDEHDEDSELVADGRRLDPGLPPVWGSGGGR